MQLFFSRWRHAPRRDDGRERALIYGYGDVNEDCAFAMRGAGTRVMASSPTSEAIQICDPLSVANGFRGKMGRRSPRVCRLYPSGTTATGTIDLAVPWLAASRPSGCPWGPVGVKDGGRPF